MKIGIVGNGFVGSSVAFGFSPQTGCDAIVKIYDKDDVLKGTVATEYGASQLQDLRFSSAVSGISVGEKFTQPKEVSDLTLTIIANIF